MGIKVYYLLAYDYEMFLISVKQLYNYVDKIVVTIDRERKTLTGNTFIIPQSFFEEIRNFDIKNKIEFYFDTFYIEELSPMENETRMRNMALNKLGRGWKIQMDVDEYIYDFESVAKYLKKHWFLTLFPKLTPITLKAVWITLFKRVNDGFLYIENGEFFPLITNVSKVTFARHNHFNNSYNCNIKVIHQSWARSDEEILKKLNNWSHANDFDRKKFFDFWKRLNSVNYLSVTNFHPLVPEVWNKLNHLKSGNINEFIAKYECQNPQKVRGISRKKMFKIAIKKIIRRE